MLRLCCALPLFNKRQLFLNEVPHKPTNPPCTAATTEDKNPMAPSWRNHIERDPSETVFAQDGPFFPSEDAVSDWQSAVLHGRKSAALGLRGLRFCL